MRSTDIRTETLPTGRWLAKERGRLLQTVGQVAKAINRHPSTIRAVERNNRVIPPGWSEDLRKLGMDLPAPAWPSDMPFYFGDDLKRDMNGGTGLRNSRFGLSKQLCVPEEEVATILRGNHVVPQDWLLKLAELGANVPPAVLTALFPRVMSTKSRLFERDSPDLSAPFPTLNHDAWGRSTHAAGPTAEAPTRTFPEATASHDSHSDKHPTADDRSEGRKPPSISFQWSREEGLQFNLSTPLLEQAAAGLKELLSLYRNELLQTISHTEATNTAEPSHG